MKWKIRSIISAVSTHSRAEAAANNPDYLAKRHEVSTHSRAEAAAQVQEAEEVKEIVSTHSRAEAAAYLLQGGVGF